MSRNIIHQIPRFGRILIPIALCLPATAMTAQHELVQSGTAPAPAVEAVESAAPASQGDGTSEFGEPLIVNGKRISDLAIKRFLCYGKGRNGLESLRLGMLMDQERQVRMIKAQENILEEEYGGKMLEELSAEERAALDSKVEGMMAKYVLDKGEFDLRLKKEGDSFAERYPSLSLETEIERIYQDMDWWKDQIRMTLEFDQLFFPGHPDEWPDLSLEAIHQASPNLDLVADYRKYYELRKTEWEEKRLAAQTTFLAEDYAGAALESLTPEQGAELKVKVDAEAGAFMPREDDMMMALLRDAVQAILNGFVAIKTSSDGIPEHLLMTIEGNGLEAGLTTEQVYLDMKDAFNEHDIYEAKLFLALLAAAKDKLQADDLLKPEAPFREKLAETKAATANAGTFGSFNFVAMSAYRFPSVEAFEDYSYIFDSFHDSIIDSLAMDEEGNLPQVLQDHLPIVQGIMGIAKVQAENLLVSAFDTPNNRWKENAWPDAYERAMDLRAQVDAYGDKIAADKEARMAAEANGDVYEPEEVLQEFDVWWANFMDLNSDFWDPPLPVTGKAPPANSMKDKGRFQGNPMTRNDLKGALGESPYTHWIWDSNAVDSIFFDVPMGSVGGPFRGPKGYYISYVKRKTPPTKSITPRDERTFKALQEDYAQLAFRRFCHAALEAAEVSGL